MKNNDKGLNIKIPSELYTALQQAADRKYISLASIVRIACAEWIERNNAENPGWININLTRQNEETGKIKECANSNMSIDDIFANLPHIAAPAREGQ